jgi:hypothetical protein
MLDGFTLIYFAVCGFDIIRQYLGECLLRILKKRMLNSPNLRVHKRQLPCTRSGVASAINRVSFDRHQVRSSLDEFVPNRSKMVVCPRGIRKHHPYFSRQPAQRVPNDCFHPCALIILIDREGKTDY